MHFKYTQNDGKRSIRDDEKFPKGTFLSSDETKGNPGPLPLLFPDSTAARTGDSSSRKFC